MKKNRNRHWVMEPQIIKKNWSSSAQVIYEEITKCIDSTGRFSGCISEFSSAVLRKLGFKEGHG